MKDSCLRFRFFGGPQVATLVVACALSFPSVAEVQPLEGEQMEDVYIMSTVTVKPTNDKSSTPYYDGGLEDSEGEKPSIGDIQRQTTSTAISRDLDDSLNREYFTPPKTPPTFEDRLLSGLQSNGFVTGDNDTLTNLPTGYTGSGSDGNYTITNPNGIDLQTSPTGLRIVLPNTGNFPNEFNGGPNSPVSIDVQGDQIILQLNNLK